MTSLLREGRPVVVLRFLGDDQKCPSGWWLELGVKATTVHEVTKHNRREFEIFRDALDIVTVGKWRYHTGFGGT